MAKRNLEVLVEAKDKASKTLGGLSKTLFTVAGGAAAVTAALYGTKKAMDLALNVTKKVLWASVEQEEIFNKLRAAVELTGENYDLLTPKVQAYLKQIQATTRFGDEVMAESLQQITQLTGSVSKGFEGAKIAADIASTGLFDLRTASRYVAMAMEGEITMLGRYIPAFKEAALQQAGITTTAEKVAYAMEVLKEKFGGAAQKDLRSFAATWQSVKNYLGDAVQAAGDLVRVKLKPWLDEVREALVELGQIGWENILVNYQAILQAMGKLTVDAARTYMEAAIKTSAEVLLKTPLKPWRLLFPGKMLKEVLAEPVTSSLKAGKERWGKIIKDTLDEIREYSKEHPIELGGLDFGGAVAGAGKITTLTQSYEMTIAESAPKVVTIHREMQEKVALILNDMATDVEENTITRQDLWGKYAETVRRIQGIIYAGHKAMCDRLAQAMFNTKTKFKDIWQGMAIDFISFFLEKVTQELANKAFKWVKILRLFDRRQNDLLAMKSGMDYANFFFKGAETVFRQVSPSLIPSTGYVQPVLSAGSALATQTATPIINLNVYALDGESVREAVRGKLGEEIRKALARGY